MNTLKHFDEFFESKKIEIINESDSDITQEIFDIVEKNLPALEKLIKQRLGVSFNLKAEIRKGNRSTTMRIYTDDLSVIKSLGSTTVKTLFEEIQISMYGELSNKENKVWFNPQLKYEHPRGGSNGTEFIWVTLFFDLDKNQWIEGKTIL